MARSLRAAALQLAAHDRADFAAVWPSIAARIREAAAGGATLIVLPEGTLPAYVLGYDAFDGTEIEQAMRECGALAKELRAVIVAGVARRQGDRTFNSAAVFDADGSIAGFADKYFLWHFDRQWFAPGSELRPIATAAGTLGVLVCADGRIPIVARTLADRGAEMLVMPTAWVTSGRDETMLENAQADLLARVRARENALPFIAANKCGVERRCVAYCGKSQIVAADGSIVAIASQDRAETLSAHIELGHAPRRPPLDPVEPPRAHAASEPVRVAIALDAAPAVDQLLSVLEADVAIARDRCDPANALPAMVRVDDACVLDPGGLARQRLGGAELAVWATAIEPQWCVAFARARALELRMYVVVFSPDRAFAVDPDGAVVCGTFGDYAAAAFTYDPARARNGFVAPGTDARAALARAFAYAASP